MASSSTPQTYLIEPTEELIVDDDKLPSNGQVLSFVIFHFEKNKKREKVRTWANSVVRKMFEKYDLVGIKTRDPYNAADKICRLFEKYMSLKGNRHLRSQVHKDREIAFLEECNNLCDVSLVNALDVMTDELVKKFLQMQRQKGRPGSMREILERQQNRP